MIRFLIDFSRIATQAPNPETVRKSVSRQIPVSITKAFDLSTLFVRLRYLTPRFTEPALNMQSQNK